MATKKSTFPGLHDCTRVGCLAHAQKILLRSELCPQEREAAAILLLMGKLFAVEKESRDGLERLDTD